jgi:deoxyadenosine/deoxycytidine kinase
MEIINIVGPMGVGKSEASIELARRRGVMLVEENYRDNPYWAETISGAKPQFMKMQIAFMNQYLENVSRVKSAEITRAVFDNQIIAGPAFVNAQTVLGMISQVDADVYLDRFRLMMAFIGDYVRQIDHVIMLDDPKKIIGRVKLRAVENREEESDVPEALIYELHRQFLSLKGYLAKEFSVGSRIVTLGDTKRGDLPKGLN